MRALVVTGRFALLVALTLPLAAQAASSASPPTTVQQTGNDVSNEGKGSGTGTVPPAGTQANPDGQVQKGQDPSQVGVNKGAGSGTGTSEPAGMK